MDKLKGKRGICISRVSQEEESSSIAQLAMLQDAAQTRGVKIVDTVESDGVTGSLPGRREDLQALLERKRTQNDFEVLFIQRLDRLTRSGSGHGFWFEHECRRAGIELVFVGDDIPDGRYANLIKVAKYEAAQEQAYSISQRSTQGSQLALENGCNITSAHTPYACWRLYLTADGVRSHIIRDLRDGRQQKLDPQTHAVIDTYGTIGGRSKGHYRKQKSERVLLMPGDAEHVAIVREIFDLHYLQGMGGKRIADVLNRRGVRSPQGRAWSQHQVEVIYEQECYTGRSVGNRSSSAIYHQRRTKAPEKVKVDDTILANAKNIPVRQRPKDEWFIQEQPLMTDFLDPQVRQLAMAAHERLWQRRGDPDRPKQSKSRHQASDYILTGLLVAKQDGDTMTGIPCGAKGKKVRYYRHRRGRRGYIKGSVYNRMISAEPLEQAVIEAAQSVLLDLPNLEQQIAAAVDQQLAADGSDAARLDELRRQREQVRSRTELIVRTLDEETLADAQSQLDLLKTRRRELDEQIAAAESAMRMRELDPADLAAATRAQLTALPQTWRELPRFQLRQMLSGLVQKVVVDLETKDIEIHLTATIQTAKPEKTALVGQKALRPVGTSLSPASYQTHQPLTIHLGLTDCNYRIKSSRVCYTCRRRPAA
jgi:hypothetical protein